MAKNGYKIFDSDTHVGPQSDILAQYMTVGDLERLKAFDGFLRKSTRRAIQPTISTLAATPGVWANRKPRSRIPGNT